MAAVTRPYGRRACFREARHALNEQREKQARPIARSCAKRLKESARRLEEEHTAQREANEAYEAWREREIARRGRGQMATGAAKPHDRPRGPTARSTRPTTTRESCAPRPSQRSRATTSRQS